ncbi:MAG: LysR family transcriptional regulator [Oscillospiraceae bacterium]|jgi:DNA-binding transcriptional LysR family regulator
MNSVQIEYFLEVARCQSFSQAAKNLYVSQPTISRQIYALEEELNISLFERTTTGTRLTESGKLFCDLFLNVKNQIEDAKRIVQQRSAKYVELKIGILEGWDISEVFNDLVADFVKGWPTVKVTFEGYPFHLLYGNLLSRNLDAIICVEDYLPSDKRIRSYHLTQIDGIMLFSAEHPLASKPNLMPYDFKDEPMYILSSSEVPISRDFSLGLLKSMGIPPLLVELPNRDSILLALCKNSGYAFFDEWFRAKNLPSLKYIPLGARFDISFSHLKDSTNIFLQMFFYKVLNFFTGAQADAGE